MSAPLSSLKILDFTTLLPGPYGTMLLADLGADVLRVEAPGRPDLLRMLEPKSGPFSVAHQYLNRSKKSLVLNLKDPKGVRVIKDLVNEYDIVVEGFRPGIMKKLGLAFEDLVTINNKLIFVSLTGYGQNGPYSNRAGHDINYQAVSGLASYNGTINSGPITNSFLAADVAGGSMHMVAGLMAAVIHRQQTGEGQQVDVAITDAAFALNHFYGAAAIAAEQNPKPGKEGLNGGGFYDLYPTRDAAYMSVGGIEPVFIERFLTAMNLTKIASKIQSRKPADQQEAKAAIAQRFLEKDAKDWEEIFQGIDCCVERVNSIEDASKHPQLKARKMTILVDKPCGGKQEQIACPIKFSLTNPVYGEIGGAPGADTKKVLSRLGYSSETITTLEQNATINHVSDEAGNP